jgi:hypothetical protein
MFVKVSLGGELSTERLVKHGIELTVTLAKSGE